MPVSLDDLTPGQRRLMARLVIGFGDDDVDPDMIDYGMAQPSDAELIDARGMLVWASLRSLLAGAERTGSH